MSTARTIVVSRPTTVPVRPGRRIARGRHPSWRSPALRAPYERRRAASGGGSWLRAVRRGLLAAPRARRRGRGGAGLRPPVPVDVAPRRAGRSSWPSEESGKTRVKDRYVVSAPAAGSLSRVTLEPVTR